ncbi:hypothetical protein P9381_14900 [Geobacillus stearothermophilus]|nr:hypothetical protein [Geobacillus stearothermophilus]
MSGPTIRFHAETVIAICGGEFSCALNGQPLVLWKPAAVKPGDVLEIGACRVGWRAYMAVAGGIDVSPVMGSRSTYVPAQLGGVSGRPLSFSLQSRCVGGSPGWPAAISAEKRKRCALSLVRNMTSLRRTAALSCLPPSMR